MARPAIAATISRVLDRPGGRRILAETVNNELIEIDVDAEDAVAAGDTGFVVIRRTKAFAL